MINRPGKSLFYGMLALSLSAWSLSACAPGPNTAPNAMPSTISTPAPTTSSSPLSAASLRFRLVADPSLARFKTVQVEDFTLCLAQIARVSTRFTYNGSLSAAASAALTAAGAQVETSGDNHTITFSSAAGLEQLLAGLSLSLPEVPASSLEGRSTFFNSAGLEIGFVTWQATLGGGAQDVTVTLSEADGASNPVSNACPRLKASVNGATLRGAGGQLTSGNGGPSATPTPGNGSGTSSPTPTPTPDTTPGAVPGVPTGLQVVEQGETYLTLQWEFPSDARSFKLYLDGREVAANHVTPNYYRFEGLRASTNYTLGVRSVNAAGESAIVDTRGTTLGEGGRSASGNFSSGGNGNTSSNHDDAPEFVQVTDESVQAEILSDVALNDDGHHVVVWTETTLFSGGEIHGTLYDGDGDVISEFQVPTSVYTYGLGAPAVAMDEDGGFAVVWTDAQGGNLDVYAQLYDNAGAELSQFRVNNNTSFTQFRPDIAMNDEGDFVVSWQGSNNFNTQNIYVRHFDLEGSNSSGDLVVENQTFDANSSPAVAMDNEGNFVVAWHNNFDGHMNARYFDAANEGGSAFEVSENPSFALQEPNSGINNMSAAMNDGGNLAFSWTEADDEDLRFMARSFTAEAGNLFAEPITDPIEVETIVGSTYFAASTDIAMDASGNFIVTWNSDAAEFESFGIATREIRAQGYRPDGRKRGTQILIEGDSDYAADTGAKIAMDDDGKYVITWFSLHEGFSIEDFNYDVFMSRHLD